MQDNQNGQMFMVLGSADMAKLTRLVNENIYLSKRQGF
jgi:hypothetical protein